MKETLSPFLTVLPRKRKKHTSIKSPQSPIAINKRGERERERRRLFFSFVPHSHGKNDF
jgi:hypothetical protein